MPRVLSPDERALWRQVTADMRRGEPAKAAASTLVSNSVVAPVTRTPTAPPRNRASRPTGAMTLDGRWDRQLASGEVALDRLIDLHGCTLHTAHQRTLATLDAAVRAGDRVIAFVTGKPPKSGASRLDAPLRGIIRASILDWIAASPVAGEVAAVRPAHRRHGGEGALYVVLRRTNRPRRLSS